jgi:hypothetical protein
MSNQILDNANLLNQLQSHVLNLLMSNLTDSNSNINETVLENITNNVEAVLQRLETVDEFVDSLRQAVLRLEARFDALDVNGTVDARISELEGRIPLECSAKRAMLVTSSTEDSMNVTVTVSSQYNDQHGVDKVRVDAAVAPGAWCPGKSFII